MTASPPDLATRVQAALGAGYTVERTIGQGGFAAVYLVRDLALKRPLAVKVLSPDLLMSATAQERFRREAETVAQLQHPHIVPLHFMGNAQDVFYLVMAFVDGESLADRIQREGRVGVDEAARILREVASALDFAHRRGVIHRDIKPHNVLLERETGRSLVTDFGIARTAENTSLTASGMVVGTPTYMSPEQITGGMLDHRADLYALGIVGWEMLVGRPPFGGTTPTEVLMKRVAQPAEPVEHARSDTPPALAAVINRCLEQDPARRFATGEEIVAALGSATPISGGHSTVEMARSARKARQPLLLMLGAVLILAAAAVAVWLRNRAAPGAPVPPAVPEGMVLVPAGTYTIGANDGPRLSRPAHAVAVDAFYLDKTEVTIAQFRRIASMTSVGAGWTAKSAAAEDSLSPVTGVTWPIAMAYCGIAHPPRGRLPTEEEWEAAARGPSGFRYPWGNRWQEGLANTISAGHKGPMRVGSIRRGNTALGVADLVGNVWEWTNSPAVAYPGGIAPQRGKDAYIIRGGAFNTPDSIADATYRGYLPAMSSDLAFTGFRCAVPTR